MSVKQKTFFALKWVTGLQAYIFISRFIINMILAKLLIPDDFGLVAIVVIITEVLTAVADLGFNAAIIQKKSISKYDINTAFILNASLSLLLTVAVYFSASLIGGFYDDIRLIPLIKLLSIILFVRAISSVQIALCDRELNFKKVVIITSIAITVSSIVKIVLAFLDFKAKSIVIGEIVNHAIISISFWVTTSWKPNLKLFNFESFKKLFSFGSKIMLTNTISLISQKVDILLIGKLITAFYVGIYSFSFMISTVMAGFINAIVRRVIFPSFSRIQNSIKEIQKLYLEAVKFISTLSVPIAVGLFFVAPEFVEIFLDPKWNDAVIIIQILSVFAVSNSLGGVLWGQVLKARGKAGMVLIMTVVRLVALVVFIFIGSKWGIIGIAISVAFYGWIFRFVYQHIVNKIIEISMLDYLKAIKNVAFASFVMIIVLSLIRFVGTKFDINEIVFFSIIVVSGVASYGLVYWIFFRQEIYRILKMIKK